MDGWMDGGVIVCCYLYFSWALEGFDGQRLIVGLLTDWLTDWPSPELADDGVDWTLAVEDQR